MKIYIGKTKKLFFKKDIYQEGEKHILCEFPTRTGFTCSILIPNLLKLKTNMIVFDSNGEAITLTKNYREKIGKVFILKKESSLLDLEKIINDCKEIKIFTVYIMFDTLQEENIKETNSFLKRVNYLLKKIKEYKIKCSTFINKASTVCFLCPEILDNLSKNNQFVLRFETSEQIKKLEEIELKKIDIKKFDIIKNGGYDEIYFNNKKLLKWHYFYDSKALRQIHFFYFFQERKKLIDSIPPWIENKKGEF